MFCALVASYGVRMVVCAVLVNHSGQSPLTLTHLIHEYHVDFPWKVCRPVASAAQHYLQNNRHMMCFLLNVILLCASSRCCMYGSRS